MMIPMEQTPYSDIILKGQLSAELRCLHLFSVVEHGSTASRCLGEDRAQNIPRKFELFFPWSLLFFYLFSVHHSFYFTVLRFFFYRVLEPKWPFQG